MRLLIEALALQSPDRTIASIKREVDDIAVQNNWPIVGYDVFRRIVLKLDKALVSLAHDGPKVYSEKFDLIRRREARHPNQIWQADHTQLDMWLLNDDGQPVRPWLGVILDDYSRAVTGYNVSFDAPQALRTALMLRQAIWRKPDGSWQMCGIPERFYTDNGSDFTSKHMEQVAADIKMKLTFSTKGKPRGRGKMERFFGTVNELFLCHMPGNIITDGPNARASMTLEQFRVAFHQWLLNEYQVREHSELESTPAERWAMSGFLPRMPQSLEQLDLLLLTIAKARRVQPDGVHFLNFRYSSPVLARYVRESVIIRYDPQDIGEIRVFHNGRFLCRAICAELESQTLSLKELIRARNQRKRELSNQLKDRKQLIDRYINTHIPTPPVVSIGQSPDGTASPKIKRYINE